MVTEESFVKRQTELSAAKMALLEKRLRLDAAAEPDLKRLHDPQEVAPLSFAQQRIWFLQQLEPESTAYNEHIVVRLHGRLDVDAFTRMVREITRRHAVMASTFTQRERQLVQVHDPQAHERMSVPIHDLSNVPPEQREAAMQQEIQKALQQSFDLAREVPWRTSLLRLDEQEYVSVTILHHIVTDAWSLSIFYREVGQLYRAFCQGQPSPLPEVSLQYADYARWQQQWLADEERQSDLVYWKEQLKGPLPVLDLPVDRPRPASQTLRGGRVAFSLDPEINQGLSVLSRQEGTTLFMTLLAAFQVLLYRYSGQEDVIVGTPIAGRTLAAWEELLGCFVNTLVMRTNLSGRPIFREVLQRVRKATLEAYEHQDIPFEKLVEELQPERSLSRNPLFQTMIVLQNAPVTKMEFENLTLSLMEVEDSTAKFDMELVLDGGSLQGYFEYNADLFEPATVLRIQRHYKQVLRTMIAHPDWSIDSFSLLTDDEWQQQMIAWNASAHAFPQCENFYELFVEQARKTPQALAVVHEQQQMTYQQVLEQAACMAARLQQEGVGPETVVAFLLERSPSFLVALIAVFQAGAAYLPLDTSAPPARLKQILEQSGSQFLLAQGEAVASFSTQLFAQPLRVLSLDTLLQDASAAPFTQPAYQSKQLAYVIYTSGSTGRAKGVMIEQRGMLNHLYAKITTLQLTEHDGVAQTASQCFDISVWQFLAPLLVGGHVRIYSDAVAHDPVQLFARVVQDRVSIVETVPSLLRVAINAQESLNGNRSALNDLRWLIPTGEALPGELAQRWFALYPHVSLLNAYGPTECSDDVAHFSLGGPDERPLRDTVPIGYPVANTRLYVLDAGMLPVPVGVSGDLYVGGVPVGRGYLSEPARTAEAFVPDPFAQEEGARLYRTGDLARYQADGALEFVGRSDYQVKLRGYRIELHEIEATLNRHPVVRESAVLLREDAPGNQFLAAYVVPLHEGMISARQLQSTLREQLPEYMIPPSIVFLQSFPLTANGKLDRRALPQPDVDQSEEEFVAPRNATEERLVEIWCSVLEHEHISVTANFFVVGGHSLLATQVLARIRDVFQVELPVRALFKSPTIAGIAEAIERMQVRGAELRKPSMTPISRESYRRSPRLQEKGTEG